MLPFYCIKKGIGVHTHIMCLLHQKKKQRKDKIKTIKNEYYMGIEVT